MSDSKRIFHAILEKKDSGPLAIFDLDSTLYNVSFRTQKIIEEFSVDSEILRRFPHETTQLRSVQVMAKDWGLREPLARAGLNASKEFFRELRRFWEEHFFSSRFLHVDIPYPGAVEYVRGLEQNGVQVIYLTGRDEPNMRVGTLKSLEKWGFPLKNPNTQLIMKSFKGSMEDETYKSVHIMELKKRFTHVWFFENEPVIIQQVIKSSPEVQVVWIDSTHSGRAHPPSGTLAIPAEWKK